MTDAVIDSGATTTSIPAEVVDALALKATGTSEVTLADGSVEAVKVYACEVAWTPYESQGFRSTLEVLSTEGDEVLIGYDFLALHRLNIDTEFHGLVGQAPENAVPLLGGGWAINVPDWYTRKMNAERFDAAVPGEVLRLHPAWRFTRPDLVKQGDPDGEA